MVKKIMPLVMAAALMASMSACGSSDNQGAEAKSPAGQEDSSQKDTLTVIISNDISTLDPHDTTTFPHHQVTRQIYETLVVRDENGELQPWLAESWEYEDDVTILLHLRKGVKFHNGQEMKASDVLFTLNRMVKDNTTASMQVSHLVLDKCEAVDDYTVRIVTDEPSSMQMSMLENPLACIISEKAYEESEGDFFKAPIGTGPYRYVSYDAGDKVILKANQDYWIEGEPYADSKALAKRAMQVIEDGFSALKLYPLGHKGEGSTVVQHIKLRNVTKEEEQTCIENVREVRSAIGDKIDLMIDVTAEGTTDTMIRIGKSIEEFKPFYYEEALDAFDVDSYVLLKEKVNIPIATGERLYTRYGFRRLIESRGVDIVQPDPGTTGGIFETLKIASMAETYQMRIAPHNCGGPVLTAACIQLSACLSNFLMQEVFPYRPDIHYNIVENPLEKQIVKGFLRVPDEPGLGVVLNRKAVEQYLVYAAEEQ